MSLSISSIRELNMNRLLEVGDVFNIRDGMSVSAHVPQHYVYANRKGDFSLTKATVTVDNMKFGYIQGTYVVTHTTFDGGGTGHGPHDVYPNGHHVFCERLDDGFNVDFYQTGAFNCLVRMEEIILLGKATQKSVWVWNGA